MWSTPWSYLRPVFLSYSIGGWQQQGSDAEVIVVKVRNILAPPITRRRTSQKKSNKKQFDLLWYGHREWAHGSSLIHLMPYASNDARLNEDSHGAKATEIRDERQEFV